MYYVTVSTKASGQLFTLVQFTVLSQVSFYSYSAFDKSYFCTLSIICTVLSKLTVTQSKDPGLSWHLNSLSNKQDEKSHINIQWLH